MLTSSFHPNYPLTYSTHTFLQLKSPTKRTCVCFQIINYWIIHIHSLPSPTICRYSAFAARRAYKYTICAVIRLVELKCMHKTQDRIRRRPAKRHKTENTPVGGKYHHGIYIYMEDLSKANWWVSWNTSRGGRRDRQHRAVRART